MIRQERKADVILILMVSDLIVDCRLGIPARWRASVRYGLRKFVGTGRRFQPSVCSDEIVHRLTACAFDFDALPRPKRVLFDLLEQPAAGPTAHLDPLRLHPPIALRWA
jgi:hypothetical protein